MSGKKHNIDEELESSPSKRLKVDHVGLTEAHAQSGPETKEEMKLSTGPCNGKRKAEDLENDDTFGFKPKKSRSDKVQMSLKHFFSKTSGVSVDELRGANVLFKRSPPKVVASLVDFRNRFAELTDGAFDGLDFSNIVCAGGAVVSCLLSERHLSAVSDLDLFIVAEDAKYASVALQRLISHFAQKLPDRLVARTLNSFTIRKPRAPDHCACEMISLQPYSFLSAFRSRHSNHHYVA